jgi:ribonuclease HI
VGAPIRDDIARNLNARIDAALLDPTHQRAWAVSRALPRLELAALAERVRRRATLLARRARPQTAAILDARDNLIQALYARDSPRGWCTAWCDGASDAPRTAGIGGLLVDLEGQVIGHWSRAIAPRDPFTTEIAALAATLEFAAAHGVDRLRVYTDCVALVRLWHEHRTDDRLRKVRARTARIERVQLRALPRWHNQPAHRLARVGANRAPRSR